MKIFLDDVRNPSECIHYMHKRIGKLNPIYLEEWNVVRNFEDFQDVVHVFHKDITHVSFDHDLADVHYNPETWTQKFVYHEKTGYDCAKWMKDYYIENNLRLPIMFVHSMNPVGIENIINLFKH